MELPAAQVDGHGQGRMAGVLPALVLRAGGLQDPFAQGDDQARFFRDRDEFGRRHHAEIGHLPAQERFGPDHAARDQVHLRLVKKFEFLFFDGPFQALNQSNRISGFKAKLRA